MLVVASSGIRHKPASSLVRMLRRADEVVESLAPLLAVALILGFAGWAWMASQATRLQFDELLELSAATAPSAGGVIATLASGVDFNPPLSHFLVRAANSLFGGAEWALRLPAFLGFVSLLVCLYLFLSKQTGKAFGLIAMLAIVCLPVREYAIQARPYGLVLGLSGLALLLFRAATKGKRRIWALAGMAVCTASLTASHYYGVLVIGVLVAGWLARVRELRKPDWPLLICCTAPGAFVLVLLRNAIVQQKLQLTHYFARGNLLSFDHGYDDFAMDPLVYSVGLLLTIVLLYSCAKIGDPKLSIHPIRDLGPGLLTLAVGLLALPLVGAVVTQFVTHAYLTRYFLPASIGLVLCFCYVLRSVSTAAPGLILISVLSLGLGFGKAVLQEAHRSPEALPSLAALTSESTPILFDTPEAYLQTYHYLPEMRRSIWAIADPVAAMRYRQYDTDDRIMLALAGRGQARIISLSSAVRMWRSFRLIPRSADYVWALKCLMDAGSQIAVRQPFGPTNFIFDISVSSEKIPAIDACGRS